MDLKILTMKFYWLEHLLWVNTVTSSHEVDVKMVESAVWVNSLIWRLQTSSDNRHITSCSIAWTIQQWDRYNDLETSWDLTACCLLNLQCRTSEGNVANYLSNRDNGRHNVLYMWSTLKLVYWSSHYITLLFHNVAIIIMLFCNRIKISVWVCPGPSTLISGRTDYSLFWMEK